MKERLLTIMNFSHIHWIDCGYISSSNGYASQEVLKKYQKRLKLYQQVVFILLIMVIIIM